MRGFRFGRSSTFLVIGIEAGECVFQPFRRRMEVALTDENECWNGP
jgi:hypothetical protein